MKDVKNKGLSEDVEKNINYQFYAQLKAAEEGGYNVSFPDLDGALTCGDNEEESLELAHECLFAILVEKIKTGTKIPQPRKFKGEEYHLISVEINKRSFHKSCNS